MSKTVFCTQWQHQRAATKEYKSTEPVFVPVKDKDGVFYLEETGQHDFYAAIQSHADETDLRQMLVKAAASGDYSFLHQVKPVFGDVSGMPSDFTEAQNRVILAHRRFDSLDPEIKSLFKNFDDYAKQCVSGSFSDAVIQHFQPVVEAPAVEVKEDA